MTKNEFNLLYAIKKIGVQSYQKLSEEALVSVGFISGKMKEFLDAGYIDARHITDKGLEALAPYKVKNAIIMAAGLSSRFVPISLEKPKGLLVVKNEVLIERQIEQLQEAGIEQIIIVLGYKKEAFFYLEDKYNVKLMINPYYNTKNNLETLYIARKYLGNSYICSSDDYFSENVFEEYVYQSFYSSVHVSTKTKEWYMIPDAKNNIAKIKKSGEEGYIMLGHAYWDNAFTKEFVDLIIEHHEMGDYDQNLWEDLLADNIKKLPPMEIMLFPEDMIHEFDSLDELRQFDIYYIKNAHSKIMKNICKVLDCDEIDILNFKPIKEGLTNTSFVFETKGKKYVYRHPGDGTEAIIEREHEKASLELAKEMGVDPTFIRMDGKEGWKISAFIEGVRTPDYENFEDSKRVLKVMRQLHDANKNVSWEFLPWEEALKIEELLRKNGGIAVSDFDELKTNVEKCYKATIGDGVAKRFCHCDTYAPNWMLTDTDTVLIDWEYAGNADPGCDVGGYIMDAMYEVEDAVKFIKEYLGESYNDKLIFHYMAYTAVIAYYWFVWALYRETCGAVMGESLHNWYVVAKKYSKYLVNNMED